MDRPDVEAVGKFEAILEDILTRASTIKDSNSIEPPILKSDIADLLHRIRDISGSLESPSLARVSHNAAVETAARAVFYDILSTYNIDEPGFVRMWNLLDIIAILSDNEECDPGLLFWLVEELLDSQMISGCRKIFDYLEARRERITKNHFKQKNLVILRSCNELLRRLSRAEDTAFCGRVFIFLFQSFPLGDKSSVNLRGEYHVENVTAFDVNPEPVNAREDAMEIDGGDSKGSDHSTTERGVAADEGVNEGVNGAKSVSFNAKIPANGENHLNPLELYPIFWSLQQNFSQPKSLFDSKNFSDFKKGLETTMITFKSIQSEQSGRSHMKLTEDSRRGTKRKRGLNEEGELVNAFNPKYLTSRELFELEISDLSFRRHIMVQSLIIMDFLLSLGSKAKEKLASLPSQNKAVVYPDQTLSEEDAKWASEMKKQIADYLKQGFEGPFYHRMVETVLSRDKHWVRWKVESCPSIEQPPIPSNEYLSARATSKKAATNKRLRPMPMGSLDLKFLTEAEGAGGLERLKSASRYRIPPLDSFKNPIAIDDMEIDFPASEESKEAAIYGKSSKSWRALRIAAKTKMAIFDKIDDPEKIDIIFHEDTVGDDNPKESSDGRTEVDETLLPRDRRPVVVTGLSGVGRKTCVNQLLKKYTGAFSKSVPHTTAAPQNQEIEGLDFHFVQREQFNIMRDGDQFLAHSEVDNSCHGISRSMVDAVTAQGKVLVLETDVEGTQQMKDQAWDARFVWMEAPSVEELERRLRRSGSKTEEQIRQTLASFGGNTDPALDAESYDLRLVNEDLDKTLEDLEAFIFERPTQNSATAGLDEINTKATHEDVKMEGNDGK